MNDHQNENWQAFESIGLRVVAQLAKRALEFYNNLPQAEFKPDRSLVSVADRDIEQEAKRLLQLETPEWGFYGEEFGSANNEGSSCYWILDPIDGTTNFLAKVPTWSILLALIVEGQPRVGIVAFPALGEVFSASSGQGATFGPLDHCVASGQKPLLKCCGTRVESLSDAHVGYSSPAQFAFRGVGAFFERLAFGAREFRTQSDAFGYSRVLCGGVDAMIDMVAAPYDLAALEVLFAETPGVVFSNFCGQPGQGAFSQGGAIAASNKVLHANLLNELRASLDPSAVAFSQAELPIDSALLARTFHRCLLRFQLHTAPFRRVTLFASEKAKFELLVDLNFANEADDLACGQAARLALHTARMHAGALSPVARESVWREAKLFAKNAKNESSCLVDAPYCEVTLQQALSELCFEALPQQEASSSSRALTYKREFFWDAAHWLELKNFLGAVHWREAVLKIAAGNHQKLCSLKLVAELVTEREISEDGSDSLLQRLRLAGRVEFGAEHNMRDPNHFSLEYKKFVELPELEALLLAEIGQALRRN